MLATGFAAASALQLNLRYLGDWKAGRQAHLNMTSGPLQLNLLGDWKGAINEDIYKKDIVTVKPPLFRRLKEHYQKVA